MSEQNLAKPISPTHRPARDRHGRGPRGPIVLPGIPLWRTRREIFDLLVAQTVALFTSRWPAVSTIEFATEDVPPSAPAQWEDHSQVLARLFPADRRRGLRDRIVIYRLPIIERSGKGEVPTLVRRILAERISHVIAIPPDELEDFLQ
ncbi:MAG: metallopeptidase family protein [Actinomycetaceae bacterium]|nr:metallopeptidase family protein [Actinomycetaceae bacterium]